MNPEVEDKDSAGLSHGRALVSLWTDLFQTLRVLDVRSEQAQSFGERIRALLAEACEPSEGATFAVRADALYFNGLRLPEFGRRAGAYRALARLLRIARVRSFHLESEVELAELLSFADRVLSAAEGRSQPEDIIAGLKPSPDSCIEVMLGKPEDEGVLQLQGHELQRRVYLGAIGVVKSVYHELGGSSQLNTKRLKRAVQDLIASLAHDSEHALRLTSVKNHDEYTFNHSVNVSVFALALGRVLGLPRARLRTLGLAAMLHDVGTLGMSRHVLNKIGRLTPEERKLFHDHPLEGFFTIATRLGVSSQTISIALTAYEHHLNVDGTGYPPQATRRVPSLESRIVAIADRYDAMTSSRIYRPHAIPPARALAIMYHSQRSQIDRTILRCFMSLIGRYPAGTAVRLSDGSIGVVVANPVDEALRPYPSIHLVQGADGRRLPAGERLDLASGSGSPDALRVVETLDAAQLGIEPMQYLL